MVNRSVLDRCRTGWTVAILSFCLWMVAPVGEVWALDGPAPGPNVGDVASIPMLSGPLGGIAVEADGTTALVSEVSGDLSRVNLAGGQVQTAAMGAGNGGD